MKFSFKKISLDVNVNIICGDRRLKYAELINYNNISITLPLVIGNNVKSIAAEEDGFHKG